MPVPRNAKERALLADWLKTVKSHNKPLERGAQAKGVTRLAKGQGQGLPMFTKGVREGSDLNRYASRVTTVGKNFSLGKKAKQEYTGTAMLGVSVLHKSNGIPVFSKEEILSIARMRR